MLTDYRHETSFSSLDAGVAAALAYASVAILAWIPYLTYGAWALPLLLWLLEKNSRFILIHAAQAFSCGIGFLVIQLARLAAGGMVRWLSGPVESIQQQYAITAAIGWIQLAQGLLMASLTILLIVLIIQALRYQTIELIIIQRPAIRLANLRLLR